MEEKKSGFFVVNIIDDYIREVSSNWWIVLITGIIAILLGISFIIYPEEALKIIAYFIGVIIVLSGIGYIKNSFKVKRIEKNYEKIKENIRSKFE